jgi:hypothetical protein
MYKIDDDPLLSKVGMHKKSQLVLSDGSESPAGKWPVLIST